MENELVSIIVPVYNTEKNIMKSCINSILMQTYKHIEIILIDDGSKDECREYCNQLMQLDERIVVIHQKNRGVSAARNTGTQSANGRYICYVDSDDYLVKWSIERLLKYINTYDVDCVIGANAIVSNEKRDKNNIEYIHSKHKGFTMSLKQYELLKRHYLGSNESFFQTEIEGCQVGRGPYARLIKSEIAKQCKFINGLPIGEDMIWNIELLEKCKSVYITFEPVYTYIIYSQNTAIRKYYGDREKIGRRLIQELENRFPDFCKRNNDVIVREIMTEWSSLLRFDLCSKKCEMGMWSKNKYVAQIMKNTPWNRLFRFSNWKYLSIEDILLLLTVKMQIWVPCINLYNFFRG